MRTLRSSVAIGGVALLLVGGTGCGTILKKAAKEGVKAATHGSLEIGDSGVTVHDSNGNTCKVTANDSGAKTVCTDSNGDTYVKGQADSNGLAGTIKDSNGDTASGKIDSNGANGQVVDSNGDTTATGSADSGGATIQDSSGTYATGTSAKLPDGWPSEFKLPSGAKLLSSASTDTVLQVQFTASSGNPDDAFNALDSAARSHGWTRSSNITVNGNHSATYTKGDKETTMSISKGDSGGIVGLIAITKNG